MASYTFTESWEVQCPVAEVAEVLGGLEHYPRWWPEVRAVGRIDDDTAWLVCRSVLPYSLNLVAQARSRQPPTLEVGLVGDLVGFARFTLRPVRAGEGTRVDFRQEVEVRGALALASFLLRPMLSWNHRRMMVGCRRGLSAACAHR